MSGDQHPEWCANRDEACEFSGELWRHRFVNRTIVTAAGEMLRVSGERFTAMYSPVAAAPSVLLTLIGQAPVRLTGRQAGMLGEHVIDVARQVSTVELVAARPGVEPHPTWCVWAASDDVDACHDSAFTRHHLSEMYELLTNDGTLIEVEGGMWTSDSASSDPLVTFTVCGKGVDITRTQAVELARGLSRTVSFIEHQADAA